MRRVMIFSSAIVAILVALTPTLALADQGTVVKWSNPLGPPIPMGGVLMDPGENIASDVDWREIMQVPYNTMVPNWAIAEDFRSDGRPILTVRWWGSYFAAVNEPQQPALGDPFVPVIEDGFLLSIFEDIPAVPGISPSEPGALLASYVAPIGAVRIQPTFEVGWDGHNIWEYEVNFQDTHLDHQNSPLATDIAFLEQAGEVYWLSIVAENGHDIVMDPVLGWISQDTGDVVEFDHWWGWHSTTEAQEVIDAPVMGSLFMPPNADGTPGPWDYQFDPANPIPFLHLGTNMAFELLTVPEPSSFVLAGFAAIFVAGYGWRRRKLAA